MANLQSGYGTQPPQNDEYGNQARRTVDEYGNPIHHDVTGTTGQGTHDTSHMATGTDFGTGAGYGTHGTTGTPGLVGTEPGVQGTTNLRRSGSSGSSSSEDDGCGGRRKKGLKEKIKEKMPGGNKEEQYGTPTGAGTGVGMADKMPGGRKEDPYSTTHQTGTHGVHQENKGVMDKVKEHLPCGKKDDTYGTTDTTSKPHPTTTEAYGEPHQEKKGMMDKIKEKLPGGHTATR